MHQLAEITLAAVMDWDATCYAAKLPRRAAKSDSKASKKKEDSLKKRYPPLNGVAISRSCIITDMHGVVLAWYLPGILTDFRQARTLKLSNDRRKPDIYQGAILAATEKLYPLLKKNGNKNQKKKSGTSWRNDPKIFNSGTQMPKGSVNISPAWFKRGHDVSMF
jgi:hypothetical protein